MLHFGTYSGAVRFTTELGYWDSALIVFLRALRARAAKCGIMFNQSGLPQPARQLLALAAIDVVPAAVAVPTAYRQLPEWAGGRMTAGWSELVEVLALVGQTILRGVPALAVSMNIGPLVLTNSGPPSGV